MTRELILAIDGKEVDRQAGVYMTMHPSPTMREYDLYRANVFNRWQVKHNYKAKEYEIFYELKSKV